MKGNNTKAIRIPGILHDDKGNLISGTVTAILSTRSDHDIIALQFEEKIQISLAFINVEKAVQSANSAYFGGRVNQEGFAMEHVITVGTVALGSDKLTAKEGRVTVAATSSGNNNRISVRFEGKAEIIVDYAPVRLLADEARGGKIFS